MRIYTTTFDKDSSAWDSDNDRFDLWHQELGFEVEGGIYGHHQLVFGGELDGGSVTVEICVPGQTAWRAIASGQDASSIVVVTQIITGIRVSFVGAGASLAPEVTISSKRVGI